MVEDKEAPTKASHTFFEKVYVFNKDSVAKSSAPSSEHHAATANDGKTVILSTNRLTLKARSRAGSGIYGASGEP